MMLETLLFENKTHRAWKLATEPKTRTACAEGPTRNGSPRLKKIYIYEAVFLFQNVAAVFRHTFQN